MNIQRSAYRPVSRVKQALTASLLQDTRAPHPLRLTPRRKLRLLSAILTASTRTGSESARRW